MRGHFHYYLGAHGGKSLVWHAYDLFFAYLLTEYFHLPAPTMGVIAMGLMLFGAVADPVAGWWISRGADTGRRLTRLQLYGALSASVAFLALFSRRDFLPPVAHAIGAGLAFQLAYKLYDLPQNALTSVLSRDEDEVLRVSSGRYYLSGLARVLVACLAWPTLGDSAQSRPEWGVPVFAGLVCAPALLSAYVLAKRFPVEGDSERAGAEAAPKASKVVMAGVPRGMHLLLIATFVNAGALSVMSRVLPYVQSRTGALIAFSIGTLLLLRLFQRLAARHGEHKAFAAAAMLAAASCAGLACFIRGDHAAGKFVLDVFALLYGGGTFACTMLLWGTAANLIHRHQASTGQRSDTFAYGLYTFASKAGIALSMISLGYVLGPPATLPGGENYQAVDKAAVLGIAGAIFSLMAIYPTMRGLRDPRLSGAVRE